MDLADRVKAIKLLGDTIPNNTTVYNIRGVVATLIAVLEDGSDETYNLVDTTGEIKEGETVKITGCPQSFQIRKTEWGVAHMHVI